jgi:hypothetical protein
VIGKRNSSRNSTRHGLLANAVLVGNESPERFADLLNSLMADFAPADNTERILVEKMAVCHWRVSRSWAIESASLIHEERRQSESTLDENPPTRTMLAIRAIGETDRHPDLMGLREHRYDREYYRALDAITKRQEGRKANTKKSGNEPSESKENKDPAQTVEPNQDPIEPTK